MVSKMFYPHGRFETATHWLQSLLLGWWCHLSHLAPLYRTVLQALPSPILNKVATESIEVVDLNLKSVRNFKLIDGLEDCSHVLLVLSESLFKL